MPTVYNEIGSLVKYISCIVATRSTLQSVKYIGFIFGIYGLANYYLETEDPEVKEILSGSITTIEHYIQDFRVEGNISYYCLKHKVQNAVYHKIHTLQLEVLYNYTHNDFFLDMSNEFLDDYP